MRLLLIALLPFIMIACKQNDSADLFIYNASIYTVDSSFSVAEAMAVKDGEIIAVGKRAELEHKYKYKEQLDAGGRFIYPGFIDAHAHFVGYSNSLSRVDLTGTKSWSEVLAKVKAHAATNPNGWIEGQGWDQNDWTTKEFPENDSLNTLFPDRPVYLTRIDGHAAIANTKALELAGVKIGERITGGTYEIANGKLTGILIDNAMDKIARQIPEPDAASAKNNLLQAQQNCFAVGLTSIHDCGLDHGTVEEIEQLQKEGSLQMRLYIMLSDSKKNYDYLAKRGIIKTDFLNVRGFKVFADGALGSRGACLLKDYSDKPGWKGFLLSSLAHFDSVAQLIAKNKWQMCTHAIGDSGNRALLKIYAKYLKGTNDLRWRIEHAQVINENDFHFFGAYNIIPSVQPTHATSDMYWAADRLGKDRIKGAYAYLRLLKENNWLPLGTDFPVEDISPFKTFYAAVVRKDDKGFPAQGFQMENALTREQALKGMTIWAAKAAFEENEKGSLEPGKFADFVILDQDIMKAPESELLKTKVLKTYLGGKKTYEMH